MKLSATDFPEVPLTIMHEVHLQEVEMINLIYELIIAIEAGKNLKPVLSEKLDAFLAHTREHFAHEEQLMQRVHFPPYIIHKKAHDQFLKELEDAVANWHAQQAIGPIDQFMRFALPRWMKDHISTMDYVTAGFLSTQAQQP